MSLVKLALAQYPPGPHADFSKWAQKQEDWVREACERDAQVLVFPEYGSLELASWIPMGTSLLQQLQEMQKDLPRFLETFQKLAKKYQVAILAPTFPVVDPHFLRPVNRAFFFGPDGSMDSQDKHSMTRFEDEDWGVGPGDPELKVFTAFGIRFGVSICFDVEFPYKPFELAKKGVQILLAPSCTETIRGLNRVHTGAKARALENQFYVAVSQTVGNAPWSEAIDINTGRAALYSTCDMGFPEDGVIAAGELQKPGWVYADCDTELCEGARKNGSVLNFYWMQRQL